MRQIKASDVKPGMTIRWTHSGLTQECTVGGIINRHPYGAVDITTPEGTTAYVGSSYPVTVLLEPQPEEPTTFGARVVAGAFRFVRGHGTAWPWVESLAGELYDWGDVCDEGQVIVIDADPSWTAAVDREPAPEVPERIEEWPEDDEHLRGYEWLDWDGNIWKWVTTGYTWECFNALGNYLGSRVHPYRGPWTRVTDA